MKVNIHGFSFNQSEKPNDIEIFDIFDCISAKGGSSELGKLYKCAITELPPNYGRGGDTQYGGMILRFRDAKSYTKYSQSNGKITLSSESLDPKDKLAEVSFFVANKGSGSGVITHYQHSPSILNFGYIAKRILRELQKARRSEIDEDGTLTGKEKRIAKKKVSGSIEVQQLCRTESIRALVKSLKRVSACEVQLKTIKTHDSLFRGFGQNSDRQTLKFFMGGQIDLLQIADQAAELADSNEVKELKILGRDGKNRTRMYKLTENALNFETFDYDVLLHDLILDLSDWNQSIISSPIIDTLRKLTQSATNKILLQ
jgi:hypothetical protein